MPQPVGKLGREQGREMKLAIKPLPVLMHQCGPGSLREHVLPRPRGIDDSRREHGSGEPSLEGQRQRDSVPGVVDPDDRHPRGVDVGACCHRVGDRAQDRLPVATQNQALPRSAACRPGPSKVIQ